MEKLLRILFVISVIAFVTTATACADDNKTAKTGGDAKTAKTGGDAKTANAGGNDKPAINPDFFLFTPEANGVTIDDSKDVYKITINPSLLTYRNSWAPGIEAFSDTPIFTVTFTDDTLQGFIIPTTVDKAEDLKTTHKTNLDTVEFADLAEGVMDNNVDLGAPNNVTHSFLADPDTDNPVFGFSATELNAAWSTLAPRAAVGGGAAAGGTDAVVGVADIMTDTKVRVSCKTTITGFTKDSFKTKTPDTDNDLPIAIGTETKCLFSLVLDPGIFQSGTDDAKKTVYKNWAKAAVELAKDDATKNIQKMSFVGIVTGDATASEITKAAGITEDADALGVKGFTADASAKLVKAYKISFQKVEIVIAVAK